MTIQTYQPGQVQQYAQAYSQPEPVAQGLSFLVHANAKAGKSALAATVPPPRVVLDAESGSFWAHSRKIRWDPTRQPPPRPDGSWDSAMVTVHSASVVDAAYRVLSSGQHPFNGVVMDSHTEVQQRCMDDLAGGRQLSRDNWGALLRQMNTMTRKFRDLITHPVRPVWGMCFIAGTKWDDRTRKWRPMIQGQAQDYLPYYVDVLGYIGIAPNGTRHLLIGPNPDYETGERVYGRLPMTMQLAYPPLGIPGWDITSMIQQVIGS